MPTERDSKRGQGYDLTEAEFGATWHAIKAQDGTIHDVAHALEMPISTVYAWRRKIDDGLKSVGLPPLPQLRRSNAHVEAVDWHEVARAIDRNTRPRRGRPPKRQTNG